MDVPFAEEHIAELDALGVRPHPSGDAALLLCSASLWQGEPKRCRWCNNDLPGKRRRWCSDDCADAFGRNHWWSWASNYRKRQNNNLCERDGCDRYALETHHKDPILGRHAETGCHHHQDGLEALCHEHHLEVHHGPRHEQLWFESA